MTEVRLQNQDGCKPGEGEILIKGRNICMGYLHMPENTEKTVRTIICHLTFQYIVRNYGSTM